MTDPWLHTVDMILQATTPLPAPAPLPPAPPRQRQPRPKRKPPIAPDLRAAAAAAFAERIAHLRRGR